jgi:transposase InsO family protein
MRRDIERLVKECPICQHVHTQPSHTSEQQSTAVDFPLQAIYMDHIGPLPASSGYHYILVIVDRFSRLCNLIPTRTTSAREVAQALVNDWITYYGVPSLITTDGASSFKDRHLQEVARYLHVHFHLNTPYRPASHGCVERLNYTVMQQIRTVRDSFGSEWSDALPALRLALNTSPNRITGYSPFFICFGQHPRLLLHSVLNLRPSVILGEREHSSATLDPTESFALERVSQLASVWQAVRDKEHAAFLATRSKLLARHKKPRALHPGQYVMWYQPRTSKLEFNWIGPCLVTQQLQPLIFLIQDLRTSSIHKAHINDLSLYHVGSRTKAQIKAEALSLRERIVSRVLSHRLDDSNNISIQVEFFSFAQPDEHASPVWIPLSHVSGDPPVRGYCIRHGLSIPVLEN